MTQQSKRQKNQFDQLIRRLSPQTARKIPETVDADPASTVAMPKSSQPPCWCLVIIPVCGSPIFRTFNDETSWLDAVCSCASQEVQCYPIIGWPGSLFVREIPAANGETAREHFILHPDGRMIPLTLARSPLKHVADNYFGSRYEFVDDDEDSDDDADDEEDPDADYNGPPDTVDYDAAIADQWVLPDES